MQLYKFTECTAGNCSNKYSTLLTWSEMNLGAGVQHNSHYGVP